MRQAYAKYFLGWIKTYKNPAPPQVPVAIRRTMQQTSFNRTSAATIHDAEAHELPSAHGILHLFSPVGGVRWIWLTPTATAATWKTHENCRSAGGSPAKNTPKSASETPSRVSRLCLGPMVSPNGLSLSPPARFLFWKVLQLITIQERQDRQDPST